MRNEGIAEERVFFVGNVMIDTLLACRDRCEQSTILNDLQVPYGNRLEALKDDRKGQHTIRVNDQWRICFRWQGQDAFDVEIVDYH